MPEPLEIQVAELRSDLKMLRELFETQCVLRHDALDKALALQAKEYERRLDLLNGEAGRLHLMQTTYMPRELYEAAHKTIETSLTSLNEYRANAQGKAAMIAGMVAFAIGILMLVIQYFLGRQGL